LSRLRVRLFAHIQRLSISRLDRTPVGDLISRCTSDVEALDTVFSSGVAVLVANLVRLLTLTVGMLILSPALTLVAGLVAPPLVTATLASWAWAALLGAGTRPPCEAFAISLGTWAAFRILLQGFSQPFTPPGEEWQPFQGALAGAGPFFATLAWPPRAQGRAR